MKNISYKISELRRAKGLTQEALGKQLGVSGQAVSKWEKSECAPDITILPKLCNILGISADNLLGTAFLSEKDETLRALAALSKKHDCTEIIFDSFQCCSKANDDKMIHGTAELSKNGLRAFAKCGIGLVICGNECVEKLKELNTNTIVEIGKLVSDSNAVVVMNALLGGITMSETEIAEVCGLEQSQIGSIMYRLLKYNLCEYESEGYFVLGPRAYAWIAILAGFFMVSLEGHKEINSISRKP